MTRPAAVIPLSLSLALGAACAAPGHAQSDDPTVDVLADGLDIVWSMAFAPDGRLFVSERPGRIRVIADGRLETRPWATVDAVTPDGSEAGLMGLAIDPDFASNGHVYACYSYGSPSGSVLNRIVRMSDRSGRASQETILVDAIPGARFHNGCRLGFGPDGMLYATTGDAIDESLPQYVESLAGKTLRMTSEGRAPNDNPFRGSLVWTLGHRNAQGIAWDPETGAMWSTEHGSSGYNELNLLERGANYGWPLIRAEQQSSDYEAPAYHIRDIPPAGAAFASRDRYPELDGGLVFGMLQGGALMFARLGDRDEIVAVEELIDDRYGRLRDVVTGPDGYLYVATSNRDQVGEPRAGDDRILRIRRF